MNTKPLKVEYSVSVIIPTFARPDRLKTCLAKLRDQHFSEAWEIVIVDDGSPIPVTRQALGIVFNQQGGEYPHTQILRQNNAGPAVARNRGVNASKGELIAFIDDDCVPEKNWLNRLVSSWRRRPGSLTGGSTINGLKKEVFAETSQIIVSLVYNHYNTEAESAYFLASNNILCSKWQFREIDGFAEDFPRAGAEDRDFCDRWRMQNWPITWDKQALIGHYHHQNLAKFIDLHIRYGRGAYIYHEKRMQRGSGTMVSDFGFHKRLPRLLVDHAKQNQWSKSQMIKTVMLLVIWQTANALGFAIEWAKSKSLAINEITLTESMSRKEYPR